MKTIWIYLKVIAAVIVLSVILYFVGGKELRYSEVVKELQGVEDILPDPESGTVIEQQVSVPMDELNSVSLRPFTYGRENTGTLDIQLLDGDGKPVMSQQMSASDCRDDAPYVIHLAKGIPVKRNSLYTLRIVLYEKQGLNPTFYYSAYEEGAEENGNLTIDGVPVDGELAVGMDGLREQIPGSYYWMAVVLVVIAVIIYMQWSGYRARQGKFTIATLLITIWKKYAFLIQQLVARDFKVKYKRSVLGYCWSFLNPLLTMTVQYIVFSTIFKSGIENYPVYLLSGNIIFTFFTDAVGQGLMSIIGNASLITKVYVPKYIYPATKVISCSINLFISLIPLLLVTILTGGRVNMTLLLLPYALICLLIFCMGMVLLLSAANVFFRDVQYLWGIISLVWMYATPLFYPAEIIPQQLRFIQTLNPMFHIISFVRSILIDGVSPGPMCYLNCLLGAAIALVIGAGVFKKAQGKFVLYI